MDDLYAALIGEGAGEGERARMIAAALRRRNEMGQLGQITGDKFLAPAGKGISQSADQYAEMLQQINQDNTRQQQTREYQTGQLDHMAATLAETKRKNDMDHEYDMAMARAAGIRAERPVGGGKIPKLRQGDIKQLQDLSQSIGIIDGLENFMKEGGKFGAVKIMEGDDGKGGVAIPGARTFKNWAASKGFGSEADKATFLAKQNWDRLYTLAERNRLFGATLTANEQKAWSDANPAVGQTDEQIRAALPIMRKIFDGRMKSLASGLVKEGYNPEALADYTDIPGVNLPQDLEPGKEAPAKTSKRVKVDAEGNIIGN